MALAQRKRWRWTRWWLRCSCNVFYYGPEQLDCYFRFGPPPLIISVMDPDRVVIAISVEDEPVHNVNKIHTDAKKARKRLI